MTRTALFIIDPQFDFCDPSGTLYVGGADADMERLGRFMLKNYNRFSDMQITLDSHHLIDIAHPASWVDNKGKHPGAFTTITEADVRAGIWRAFYPPHQERYLAYVTALAAGGRYPLTIWPPHCLIGTVGATIVKPVVDGMLAYENQYRLAGKVSKGSNIYTEHYSAVKAEVEDPQDPFTKINKTLIDTLKKNDRIILAGEAYDYCLANTAIDIMEVFSDDDIKKMVLFEDCASSVIKGGPSEVRFRDLFAQKGGTTMLSTDFKFD